MAATAIPTGNRRTTVIFSTPGRRPRPVAESASHRGDTRFPRPAAALARQRLPMTVGHLLLMLLHLLFLILSPLFQQY
jgi:hypothetical protein